MNNCSGKDDQNYLNSLIDSIKYFNDNFNTRFPNLGNIDRFFPVERYQSDIDIEKRKYNGIRH